MSAVEVPSEAERLLLERAAAMVRGAMALHGVNQNELARRLGCSAGHVSLLLSGERNLTLRSLARMADALGGRVAMTLIVPGGDQDG